MEEMKQLIAETEETLAPFILNILEEVAYENQESFKCFSCSQSNRKRLTRY